MADKFDSTKPCIKRTPSLFHPCMLDHRQDRLKINMQHINAILFVPLLLFILITFSIYYLFNNTKAASPWRKKKNSSPPSPPRLPFIGNLHQLGTLPHRSLRNLSDKLGPVMLLRLGRVPAIVVSSAEAAREVMKTHDLIFSSRPHSTMTDRLFYGSRDLAFTPYGEHWRQMRRICVLHLFSLKRVQSFQPVRQEEVALMVEKIRASPGPVNLSEIIVRLTNDLICRVAFGRKHYSKSDEGGGGAGINELLTELYFLLGKEPIGDFIPWLSWIDWLSGLDARVRKNSIEFDAIINNIIDDHLLRVNKGVEDDNSNQDFVDILLSFDVDKVGISLSRDSIKALILDIFAAGTDTNFAVLQWTMAELIRHPATLKKVQEEVRRAAIPNGSSIEVESIDEMNYMKAVIKEALRLHPPAPLLVPRETTQDVQLCGYEIPARTRVIINAWAIGRDPSTWERPEEFWPERFVNSSVDFRGQDFELIPFGAGRRGCPAIGFSISTIELALANLLHHFDWELPGSLERGALNMAEAYGLTTHMKSSLILVAKPRLNN